MDARAHLIRSDVARRGLHVVRVLGGEGAPAYAYSIGLMATFAQAEIVVFGLPPATLQAMIERLTDEVRGGARFAAGDRTGAALDGCKCAFRDVPARLHESHLGHAVQFYGAAGFSAVQCVWPDRGGRYPWDRGFDEALRRAQPILEETGAGRGSNERESR